MLRGKLLLWNLSFTIALKLVPVAQQRRRTAGKVTVRLAGVALAILTDFSGLSTYTGSAQVPSGSQGGPRPPLTTHWTP